MFFLYKKMVKCVSHNYNLRSTVPSLSVTVISEHLVLRNRSIPRTRVVGYNYNLRLRVKA